MRAHQLDGNGKIINTIIVDSLDFLPNLVDANIGGGIGDSIVDGVAVLEHRSTQNIPTQVTRRQGLQALLLGDHLSNVQVVIASIADPTQRGMAQIWFDDSPLFERAHPMVTMFGTGLDMSSDQLDALFILAATM